VRAWLRQRRWRRIGAAVALGAPMLAALMLIAGQRLMEHQLGPVTLAGAQADSRLVLDRSGQLLRAFTTDQDRWRLPASLDAVDPRFVAMLLAYEDNRFYRHGGIDILAMARAAWQLARHGRPISGGSTITMQLGRLLDDLPTRSVRHKLVQIVRARQIERRFTKRDILELYLKLAPYGGNIEGVRAAALAYFGKEPVRLAVHEAALLVALPQSPETRRPDRFPDAARRARDRVLDRLAGQGVITRAEADWGKTRPVPRARSAFPLRAAHLCDRLVSAMPERTVIRTTIDGSLQASIEAAARETARRMGPQLSVAAMVVDHDSGDVLAHIGSPGYLDAERWGAIDMTRAVRSPGSALKPFIYGMAFEDGLAHPATLIEDRPTRFGRYAPKNFEGDYQGSVSVAEALQHSLNVPAVKLLAGIGPARVSARLRQAGFGFHVPRNLAIALGGIGLQLSELSSLYAALARGGQPITLRYVLPDNTTSLGAHGDAPGEALLSPAAAWYVSEILRQAPAPENARSGRIAYKTGTSYGHRDAWAAGSAGRFTVVVWVGRPDGTSTPGLTGRSAAAPLLFDIFARLDVAEQRRTAPKGVLAATTAQLPLRLRYFAEPGRPLGAPGERLDRPLRIAFPPDGAELAIDRLSIDQLAPVAFKAEGGALPLVWLVNGVPVASPAHQRQTFWTPTGEGFISVLVVDAEGRQDRVQVRLR
jgi:penicillin-binding protein 1C